MRRLMNWAAATAALVLMTGCASYANTKRLDAGYDLDKGYRFDKLNVDNAAAPKNSDELFVVLAFSGGGTRASALSYGVMAQLRAVKFHWDPVKKAPTTCDGFTAAQCTAMERSLLDEVDVISTVSGGSFPAAYYALHGDAIFNPDSAFHKNYLYHPVQSDLMKEALYNPANWTRAQSRIETAANYYAEHVFGNGTYGSLSNGKRPYIILNSTDASTGARFEFTQEQFDLLCANLDSFPVARAAAASSAFPVLLNSMTIDSYTAGKGCGYTEPTWFDLAERGRFFDYRRYNTFRDLKAYRDSGRVHLHILDGGLADNIGLRSVLQSLSSEDRPDDVRGKQGGWSLLNKINLDQVKTIVVISVNARTNSKKDWDQKKKGPGLVSVVDASAGIPMGNFTTETLELLREYGFDANLNGGRKPADTTSGKPVPFSPRFFGVEVSFENIRDVKEREYFENLGTNFQLPPFAVTCLADRGARLLQEAGSVTDKVSQSFASFAEKELKGSVGTASVPHEVTCTDSVSRARKGDSRHTIDIGLQYNIKLGGNSDVNDVTKSRHNIGLLLRVAKPNGLGATLGVTRESFVVPGVVGGKSLEAGRLTLLGATVGGVLSGRVKAVQGNLSLAGGYSLADFDLSSTAREQYAQMGTLNTKTKSSGSFLLRPGASVWVDVMEKFAITFASSYIIARPTIRYEASAPLANQQVKVNALRLSAGIGYRIF